MEMAGWIKLNVANTDPTLNYAAVISVRVSSIVCVTTNHNEKGEENASVVFIEGLPRPFLITQLKDEVLKLISEVSHG